MKPNLHFKFSPIKKNNEIDLSDLGNSLVGFDRLIRDLVKVTCIRGDVSVQAVSYRDGSIVVDTVVKIKEFVDLLPFERIDELLDFLQIVNAYAWQKASEFFNEIKSSHRTLNDYFASNPLDFTIIAIAITYMIDKAKSLKELPFNQSMGIPTQYAMKLHKLIHKDAFKTALKPIVEDKIDSVEISVDRSFEKSVKIDQENFHHYLGDDDQILPHLENGEVCDLKGEITSLKSTRGDSLTFKYIFESKEYNLDLFPPQDETTKNYTDYYKEKVNIKAEVIRTSIYKKPKLKLTFIELRQMKLFDN